MIEKYLNVWKRSFDYQSRATRSDVLIFTLIHWFVALLLSPLLTVFQGSWIILFFLPFALILMVSIVPSLSMLVRRFHDMNMSGKWLGAYFVLSLILFYLMVNLMKGFSVFSGFAFVLFLILQLTLSMLIFLSPEHFENRYGKDPRG
ncbi:DUF805 domain-containing protein [Photobacterium sp. 1_MG-2023]|uniref:DUF805 domain-containing protein n=1 Tax=Photobacterium sp. 1_MG-2023 TaxID=3062646 RepID=UPI0026E4043B|nr:DUF805 domain-containing protein [Photobacterium sp. 1_MG-2023]MDO6707888.1 DUF805 domain-containing protein [Photobacterium sp. 1_MG-2023]